MTQTNRQLKGRQKKKIQQHYASTNKYKKQDKVNIISKMFLRDYLILTLKIITYIISSRAFSKPNRDKKL